MKNDSRIGHMTTQRVLVAVVVVAGGLLGLSSCGSGDEAQETTTTSVSLPVAVEVTEDVPVTSTRTFDIYEPVEGGPWPVVVLWHGQPLGLDAPEDFRQAFELAPLAEAIARQGAVVFNASYSVRPARVSSSMRPPVRRRWRWSRLPNTVGTPTGWCWSVTPSVRLRRWSMDSTRRRDPGPSRIAEPRRPPSRRCPRWRWAWRPVWIRDPSCRSGLMRNGGPSMTVPSTR